MPFVSSASLRTHLALITALSFTSLFLLYKSHRLRSLRPQNPTPNPRRGKLFFFSQTNTSKTLASRLLHLLNSSNSPIPFDLVDPQSYEPEDLVKETLVLFVASTWEDGKPPPNGEFLARWLAESAEDFRVGSLVLSRCDFAVFGVGSGAYEGSFNKVARELSLWMRALGGKELVPVMESDVDRGEVDERFGVWSEKVIGALKRGGDDGVVSDGFEEEVDDEDEEEGEAEDDEIDMEDIAGKGPSRKLAAGLVNGEDGSKEKSLGNGDDGARDSGGRRNFFQCRHSIKYMNFFSVCF